MDPAVPGGDVLEQDVRRTGVALAGRHRQRDALHRFSGEAGALLSVPRVVQLLPEYASQVQVGNDQILGKLKATREQPALPVKDHEVILGKFLGAWGLNGGPADINNDGIVNAADLLLLLPLAQARAVTGGLGAIGACDADGRVGGGRSEEGEEEEEGRRRQALAHGAPTYRKAPQ